MTVLLHCVSEARQNWMDGLKARLGDEEEVLFWPDVSDQAAHIGVSEADAAFVWAAPQAMFDAATGLKAVFSLGAGLDHLLGQVTLRENVRIWRVTDGGMAQQFAEYALYGVLHFSRDFDIYAAQQHRRIWQEQNRALAIERRIGVLGLGALGSATATAIARTGFQVCGWSKTPKALDGINTVHGPDGLTHCLQQSDILVLCLPLTPETHQLLNAESLNLLPQRAAVINLARGGLIDEPALIAALEGGRIRGAMLDVFESEPLADTHPLWRLPNVIVTPHIAGRTLFGPTLDQHVSRLRGLRRGEAVSDSVDISRGY